MRLQLRAAFAVLAAASTPAIARQACGTFPALDVKTPPGFCVALLSREFKFPRGVLPLENGELLVADMGGWDSKTGGIWLLKPAAGAYVRTPLFTKLDRPN